MLFRVLCLQVINQAGHSSLAVMFFNNVSPHYFSQLDITILALFLVTVKWVYTAYICLL